jgi:hypothetical protein
MPGQLSSHPEILSRLATGADAVTARPDAFDISHGNVAAIDPHRLAGNDAFQAMGMAAAAERPARRVSVPVLGRAIMQGMQCTRCEVMHRNRVELRTTSVDNIVSKAGHSHQVID